MRCVISRNQFCRSVEFAGQFTYVNTNHPITELMKLSFSHDKVVVSAYCGESQTEITLSCECNTTAELCVNAARLVKILKACDDDHLELDIEFADEKPVMFTVKNFDDTFQFPAIEADLPSLPSVSQYHLTLPSGLLTRAISMVVAADVESSRYALGGVWFNFKQDEIELAATDGRRMMYYRTPYSTGIEQSLLVPVDVLKRLGKLGEVELSINENLFKLVSDNVSVVGRQIEGRYPNVHKVIESTEDSPAARREIDRVLLLNSLKRATLMTSDGNYGVDINACGRRLTMSTASIDVGKAKVCLDCESERGEANFDIALDVRFVQQMVSVLDCDTVEFNYFSEEGACTFIGDQVKCILMPMTREKKKVQDTEEVTA